MKETQPKTQPSLVLLITTALVVAVGCSPPDAPDGSFPMQDNFVEEVDSGGVGEYDPQWLPTLDGTWVVQTNVSTCVDFVNAFEQYYREYFLVETEQDSFGTLTETWTACRIDTTEVLSMLASVTPALLDTAFPITVNGGLWSGSTAIGDRYSSGAFVEVWGINFEDRLNDEFPTNTEDPRIYDMDEDGNPGTTLIFSDFCEAYLVQRATNYFVGEFVAPDRIEGGSVSTTRQLMIRATEGLCETQYSTRPNAPRSTWARQRVDGQGGSLNFDSNGDGVITCEEALPFQFDLFEFTEINDEMCELEARER